MAAPNDMGAAPIAALPAALTVALGAGLAALLMLLALSAGLGLQVRSLHHSVQANAGMQPALSALQAQLASKDTQVWALTQALTESKADVVRLRDQELPAVHMQYKEEVARVVEELGGDLSGLADKLLEQLYTVRNEVGS